jgi:UDP-N-acetylmuramoyl-tripeptide--D-alanyl-D-alanine ligase
MSYPDFTADELAAWCGGRWQGAPPARVTGVVHDSREVTREVGAGQLYVAIRGAQFDGHAFIAEAARRGAVAALVDEAFDGTAALPCLRVADTQQALTALAAGHRARCGGQMIGITGSVGKTSVKEWIADLLAADGVVARTHSNWNNAIGLPLSLLRMPVDSAHGVFEVGMNHPGELAPLCALLQPAWGVLTPIGPAHIENFPDVAAIAEEKATLLDALPADGLAFLSLDDPWYPALRRHVRCALRTLSWQDESADYYAAWEAGSTSSFVVHERASGARHVYAIDLPGQYMADNALRAIAVAREAGVSAAAIRPRLLAYRPPGMRWREEVRGGFRFINDAYNANPLSMRAAIEAFARLSAPAGRWLVLGGMRELGEHEVAEHEALGRWLAERFQTERFWAGVLTVGALARDVHRTLVAARSAAGGEELCCRHCDVVDEAAAVLRAEARPGAVILLKGSRGEQVERVLDGFGDA